MAHDASNNNPKKEIVHALLGFVLLLVIVAGIAVSGWLRPAGSHEVATVPATEKGKLLEEKLKSQEAPKEEATEPAAPASATSAPETNNIATAQATAQASATSATQSQ